MLFLELEPIINQSNKNHMNDFMIMLFTFFFFQLSKITEQKKLADRGNYVINIMFWPNKYKIDFLGQTKYMCLFYILNITSTVLKCNGLLPG